MLFGCFLPIKWRVTAQNVGDKNLNYILTFNCLSTFFSQVLTLINADEGGRHTRDSRPWNWKKNSNSTGILPDGEE